MCIVQINIRYEFDLTLVLIVFPLRRDTKDSVSNNYLNLKKGKQTSNQVSKVLQKSTATPSEASLPTFSPAPLNPSVYVVLQPCTAAGAPSQFLRAPAILAAPTKAALSIATTHFIIVGDIHFSESLTEAGGGWGG